MTKTRCKHYYYSDEKIFEKSLDVWEPVSSTGLDPHDDDNHTTAYETSKSKDTIPVIVLVVGSGWVGHRAFVYGLTSWWNSAGPRTFARLGYTCVCIRHRGAFPVLPDTWVVFSFLLFSAMLSFFLWGSLQRALVTTMIVANLFRMIPLGGHGSITNFEDMLHDVTEALAFVRKNRRNLLSGRSTVRDRDMVFGGYSSGGHVAATLLQRPELFLERGLPPPDKLFVSIVMISGVLAVRPLTLSSTTAIPSSGDHHGDNHDEGNVITSSSHGTSNRLSLHETERPIDASTPLRKRTSPPRWFTDFVVHTVWGKDGAPLVPSPLHLIAGRNDCKTPRIPHLLIGCKNEVFGLTILDLFFCSCDYVNALQEKGIVAKSVQIDSDHWNILNSSTLRNAIIDHQHWISGEITMMHHH